MQNTLPIKKVMRLSRFSQNVNSQLLKNLHSFISRQALDDKQKNNHQNIDSLIPTKRSIIIDDKRISKDIKIHQQTIKQPKQSKQEDLFAKQNNIKKDKYYDPQQIKKYKQSMMELPNLHDKNKKTKYKHITPQFIQFFFQVLKSLDIVQKIFSSYVPHQAVVNQFFNILNGFKIKTQQVGITLQLGKQVDEFYILMEGAAQKVTVKQAFKLDRKSSLSQCSSQTSIIRRSKMKNKTVTQKGKILSFENNLPVLINEKQVTNCTIKTIGMCRFLLLQKDIWSKFMMALQKLEERHLVGYIKHCTTINLNICIQKQNKQKKSKRRFLQQLRYPDQIIYDQQDNYQQTNKKSQRKTTIHNNSLNSSYKLFNLLKDQKMAVNNQDVYLIIKGTILLTTESYTMIINQGSLINSSVLLDLTYKEVNIKALNDSLIVKLLLTQIYFQKQDQTQFINKIQEIQQFRNKINKKSHQLNQISPIKNIRKTLINYQNLQTQLNSPFKDIQNSVKSKFQPKQLKIKQLSFIKGQQNKRLSPKRARINHSSQIKEQPQSKQTQLARKVALKYANNYCIFQKIVQSQQKVIQTYNLNRVNKLFPIQALLRNLNFTKVLQQGRTNSNKHTFKKVNFIKTEQNQTQINQINQNENEIQRMHSNYLRKSRVSNKSNKSNKSKQQKKNDLLTVRKRRQKYGKTLIQKKKRQRAKIIQNLFQINLSEDKNIKEGRQRNNKSRRTNQSLNLHKQRIKQIVNRNSQMKLKQFNSQRKYINLRGSVDLKGNNQYYQNQDYQTNKGLNINKSLRSKYSGRFLVTQPNYCQISNLQKAISGQNLTLNYQQLFKDNRKPQKALNKTWVKINKNNLRQTFMTQTTNYTQINNQNQTNNITQLNNLSGQLFFSDDFFKLKKRTTNRIKTTMLTGRIRQSKPF